MNIFKSSNSNLLIFFLLASNFFLISKDFTGVLPDISSSFQFHSNSKEALQINGKELAVSIAADKMNVLYVGVDNPISINTFGKKLNQFTLTSENEQVKIEPTEDGKYNIKVSKTGEITLLVTHLKSKKTQKKTFRVKRMPNPTVLLAKNKGGLINSGQFKGPAGMAAWLDNFDFDARCLVQSYTLYYTPKGQSSIKIEHRGGRFSGKVRSALQQAKPTDLYSFVDVKVRCPGDKTSRSVNSLAFLIR
jgi:biopolymer transport protein ExbD